MFTLVHTCVYVFVYVCMYVTINSAKYSFGWKIDLYEMQIFNYFQ